MAKVKSNQDIAYSQSLVEVIDPADFSQELSDNMVAYGQAINIGRGLPEIRDGLKTVHRRLIHASWFHSNLRPNGRVRKSAVPVANTMGMYHPHGDSAIYSALVGLSQDFKINHPLFYGEGNFGTLEDGAAAMRYTECRLSPLAAAIVGTDLESDSVVTEVEEGAVPMVENYDNTVTEPLFYPSQIPLLLVNGAMGMGYGIACNFAAHPINEVLDLAYYMSTEDRNPTAQEIRQFMPGPDSPTGCDIYNDRGGIESYFNTGRGSYVERARYDIKKEDGSHVISFTHLPRFVSDEKLTAAIRDAINTVVIPSKCQVDNVTEEGAICVSITIPKESDPHDIVNRLFYSRVTRQCLERTVTVNMNGVDSAESEQYGEGGHGKVVQVSVGSAMNYWIDHRVSCIEKRTDYRLKKAEWRLHLVEGVLIAIGISDQIIPLIRGSEDKADAIRALVDAFQFSEGQSEYIVNLNLHQFARKNVQRYEEEVISLNAQIIHCNEILADPLAHLSREILIAKERYGSERKGTYAGEEVPALMRPEELAENIPDPILGQLGISEKGMIRWGKRANINRVFDGDYITQIIPAYDANHLEIVTNFGNHMRMPVSTIPNQISSLKVLYANAYQQGEESVMIFPNSVHSDASIVLVTNQGNIKRVHEEVWERHRSSKVKSVIGLRDEEYVVQAFIAPETTRDEPTTIGVVTSHGHVLRFPMHEIRASGAVSKAVSGIKLGQGDSIVWAGTLNAGAQLVYWTSTDKIGAAPVNEIDIAHKSQKGSTLVVSDSQVMGAYTLDAVEGDAITLRYQAITQEGDLSDLREDFPLSKSSMGLGDKGRQKSLNISAPGISTSAVVLRGPALGDV